jgi:ATP-dependent DNA ligase
LTKCLARIDLKRYPLIVESAAHIQGSAILDAEVVWLDSDGIANTLHSRVNDATAIAFAFDILMHNGDDVRRKPFAERKAILRKVIQRTPSRDSIYSLALRALFQRNSTRRTSRGHQRRG